MPRCVVCGRGREEHKGRPVAAKESRTEGACRCLGDAECNGAFVCKSRAAARKETEKGLSISLFCRDSARANATFSPAGRLEIARRRRGRCAADVTGG